MNQPPLIFLVYFVVHMVWSLKFDLRTMSRCFFSGKLSQHQWFHEPKANPPVISTSAHLPALAVCTDHTGDTTTSRDGLTSLRLLHRHLWKWEQESQATVKDEQWAAGGNQEDACEHTATECRKGGCRPGNPWTGQRGWGWWKSMRNIVCNGF